MMCLVVWARFHRHASHNPPHALKHQRDLNITVSIDQTPNKKLTKEPQTMQMTCLIVCVRFHRYGFP